MTTEELIKEINELQDRIDNCPNEDWLNNLYQSFGNTTVVYANGEEKVFEPHYWVLFGKQIIENLKVEIKRDGGNK